MTDPTSDVLSPDTQVALLLHGRFGGARGGPKPLAPGEFNKLGAWLRQEGLQPSDLLAPDVDEVLDRLPESVAEPARVRDLLRRGTALAFAVEEWVRRGLWVVGRADAAYPERLRSTLRSAAPPVLYGAGEIGLLEGPALGVVGSRNADEDALAFTREVGERCAREGVCVVSGGAKGVDWEAMSGVLDTGGEAVGVLAEGVAKPATSKRYRDALRDGRLVLLSPYAPDARWTTYNAMARNKVVYGLSDHVLVVSSDTRGGTWEGATENLKRSWVPVLARVEVGVPVGNRRLVEMGATPLVPHVLDSAPSVQSALNSAATAYGGDGDLFSQPPPPAAPTDVSPEADEPDSVAERPAPYELRLSEERGLFDVVWPHIAPLFESEVSSDDVPSVADRLQVQRGQLASWLKLAEEEGLILKHTRPVQYVVPT